MRKRAIRDEAIVDAMTRAARQSSQHVVDSLVVFKTNRWRRRQVRRALRTSGPRASAMLVGNARRVSGGASSPPETLAPTVSRATSSAPRDGTGSHAPRVRARGPCSPPAPGSGAEPDSASASSPPASASSPSASANRRGSPPGELSARAKRELEAEVALLRARINDSASAKEASERMHEHLARRAERAARVAAKKHGRLALPPEFEVGGGEAEPGVREAARIAQRAGVRRPTPGTTAAIAADDARRARRERSKPFADEKENALPPRPRPKQPNPRDPRECDARRLGGRPPRAREQTTFAAGAPRRIPRNPPNPRAAKPRTTRAGDRGVGGVVARGGFARPEHRPLMDWFEERGVGREGRRFGDDKDATLGGALRVDLALPTPPEGGRRRATEGRARDADDSDSDGGSEPVGGTSGGSEPVGGTSEALSAAPTLAAGLGFSGGSRVLPSATVGFAVANTSPAALASPPKRSRAPRPRLGDDDDSFVDSEDDGDGDFPSPAPSAAAAYIGRVFPGGGFSRTSPAAFASPGSETFGADEGRARLDFFTPRGAPTLRDAFGADDETLALALAGEDRLSDLLGDAEDVSFGDGFNTPGLPDFTPTRVPDAEEDDEGVFAAAGEAASSPSRARGGTTLLFPRAAAFAPSPRSDAIRREEECAMATRIQACVRGRAGRAEAARRRRVRDERRARENGERRSAAAAGGAGADGGDADADAAGG